MAYAIKEIAPRELYVYFMEVYKRTLDECPRHSSFLYTTIKASYVDIDIYFFLRMNMRIRKRLYLRYFRGESMIQMGIRGLNDTICKSCIDVGYKELTPPLEDTMMEQKVCAHCESKNIRPDMFFVCEGSVDGLKVGDGFVTKKHNIHDSIMELVCQCAIVKSA